MVQIRSIEAKEIKPVSDNTATPDAPKETEEPSQFETLLRSLLPVQGSKKVSEEELFSALVEERLTTVKGAEVGEAFKNALGQEKSALQKPDGFIPFEKATENALKKLVANGIITIEEANSIYAQAFGAAQLDSDHNFIYDDRGGPDDKTIAVEALENALMLAKAMIEKFEAGTEQAPDRSLIADETATTMPADTTTPQGTTVDGADGFLFKPISSNQGTLAVLLPEILAHQVETVVLKDLTGVIEEGQSMGYGELGTREKFSFSRKGGSYPKDLTVEVRMVDGSIKTYHIPDPSKRYD